jgi:tetratricopeptide (TPR) repeat protein
MKTTRTDQLGALLQSGYRALSEGRIADAVECCRQALQVKPDFVDAHFLVGLCGLESKNRKTAIQAFTAVTRLQPGHAAAWAHLAKLFIGGGWVNRADAALAEAVKHGSEDPVVLDMLGSVYSRMGEYGLAGDWFEKAVSGRPEYPPFMFNLANNYVYRGRIDEAADLFQRIIAIQPNSPQVHWSLAGVRKVKDDKHIDEMRSLLAPGSLHPRARAYYYFGIGKELEDLESWDEAFDAFRRGAKARRQTVEYDEAAEIEMFRFLEDNFDSGWLHVVAGHESRAPIFVLGQPRTGTTLIERIISSHSQVQSAGELQQFSLAVRRLSSHRGPRQFSAAFFAAAKDIDPAKLGALYLETSQRMRGETPRFVDKLPHNYLMIPLIMRALPHAKIVHLVRDPMDACFASYKQLFADAYLHSYDLGETARHHARYLSLMDTWRKRFPGGFFDISYEDTVGDLEKHARALIDYLELPWEDSCLRFHEKDEAVSTASAVQVREPVHTRSIGRWRRYEQQLAGLRAALQQEGVRVNDAD